MDSFVYDQFSWMFGFAKKADLDNASEKVAKLKKILGNEFKEFIKSTDEEGPAAILLNNADRSTRLFLDEESLTIRHDSIRDDAITDYAEYVELVKKLLLSEEIIAPNFNKIGIKGSLFYFPSGATDEDKDPKHVLAIGEKLFRYKGDALDYFGLELGEKTEYGNKLLKYSMLKNEEKRMYCLRVEVVAFPYFSDSDSLGTKETAERVSNVDILKELDYELKAIRKLAGRE